MFQDTELILGLDRERERNRKQNNRSETNSREKWGAETLSRAAQISTYILRSYCIQDSSAALPCQGPCAGRYRQGDCQNCSTSCCEWRGVEREGLYF